MSDGWTLINNSETEVKKLECPNGHTVTVFATLAVASKKVHCSECGCTKDMSSPNPVFALAMVLVALGLAKLLDLLQRVRSSLPNVGMT